MFCAALCAYWAFAGLHPGPTTGWVSSCMQAAVAQQAGFFIFLCFLLYLFLCFFVYLEFLCEYFCFRYKNYKLSVSARSFQI